MSAGTVINGRSCPSRKYETVGSAAGRELTHLTARLASYERRMTALTYDASLVDLGNAG